MNTKKPKTVCTQYRKIRLKTGFSVTEMEKVHPTLFKPLMEAA